MTLPTSPASPFLEEAGVQPVRLEPRDWGVLGLVILLTIVVFANGLRGDFVLDDQKQIVRNDLIRLPKFWPQALTRDLWAFEGERDEAWSNYWRPGHVLWLIVNYRLFAGNPVGWHVTSLLAHLGVVVAAYVVVRWLGAGVGVAAAIISIFAVHPTRAESVTWIAGVHDVLATLGQLLALICLMTLWRREQQPGPPATPVFRVTCWSAAIVLYALAIGTKEIAIFFPLIVALVRFTSPGRSCWPQTPALRQAVLSAVPFIFIAGAFLIARRMVLGSTQLRFPWQPDTMTVITSLPLVVTFYLRQIVFPYWIGWSYPIRVVTAENVGLWTFFVPLALIIAIAFLSRWIIRGRLAVIGAAVFLLALLPALNLKAFLPEQIVKDRYLYLPLLGFLMVVIPLIAQGLDRWLGRRAVAVGVPLLVVLVVLMGVRTFQYNFAWRSEVALWEWAVWSDATSATNYAGLGTALMLEKKREPALEALDRSIEILPTTNALAARAELFLREGHPDRAEEDARRLIKLAPEYVPAYERLAIALERQGRRDEAADVYREAREVIPFRYAAFTDQLAVVLYNQGRKDEALRELEQARARAELDFLPGSRLVLFHLGMLYHEQGRTAEATATLRRFMELTEGSSEPNLLAARRRVAALLGNATK